ncbi:MAG TPA: histidine ammonia-lyase [Thermoplasmata archaeon]|nr:histidine ammonia-lyase [Thermoplasmata archaeon]
MTESLPIDGRSLTLEQFLAVARDGCAVALAPEARPAIAASRRVVERAVARGIPVYGVTTGYGALSDRPVPASESRALQLGLVRSHASGAGPFLPPDVVRGMLLVRANSLAAGHSGVRPEIVERLLELLNRRLTPAIPSQGSVGASGDLAPLAHLALAAIGEGEFLGPDGATVPAARALADAGIPPIDLAEKEGVALVNGTSLMTSYLALSVHDLDRLREVAEIAGAISFDALRGDPEALDDRLGALKNLPEPRAEAEALRHLLEGSHLAAKRARYEGQDPYTLRCLPQVLASVRLAIGFARRIVEAELNAVSDNPIVFEGDEFVNGGNFHGQSLALALDTLAIAGQYLAAFSERRTARLVDPARNRGLPAFLAPDPGRSSGLMIPQYLAAALVNENQSLVHPASAASLPTSADQEDYVSMGAWAGAKLRRLLDNVRTVLSVEWIVAAQALELRRPASGGRGSEAALRAVRTIVRPWSADRSPSPDIRAVAEAVADGSLVAKVRAEVPF